MPVTFKKCMPRCWSDAGMYMPKKNKVPPFCLNAVLLSTNSLINKYSPYSLAYGFWK